LIVSEMLELPELKELRLVAGAKGLSNKVTNVSVMDAPDIYNWMRGNEFLITTAYIFKDDVGGLSTLIHKLSGANVAAFGIKTNRFIGSFPDWVIEAANSVNLPLIHIPDRFPWTEIILPVMQCVLDENNKYLKQQEEIHDLFIRLAISNSRISETLSYLEPFMQRPVAFLDLCFNELYFSNPEDMFSQRLKAEFDTDRWLSKFTATDVCVHEVANQNTTYGKIFYDNRQTNVSDHVIKTALEYASIVMIIRMQTRLSNRAIEDRYREQFLADLLFDNIKSNEEVQNRANLYNWNFANGGVVVVVDINNYKRTYINQFDATKAKMQKYYKEQIFNTVIKHISDRFQFVLHYEQSDYIAFIILPSKSERLSLRERLQSVFADAKKSPGEKTPFTSTMGVGSYCEKIRDISKSFIEARNAINLGYQSDRFDCVLFYEDQGISRLLQNLKSTREAKEYVDKYIMPLVQHEKRHNIALLETLQALIDADWKLKAAAIKLHVHYNSVKYRFSKMCELLEIDLRLNQQQINVQIAWNIYLLDRQSYTVPFAD